MIVTRTDTRRKRYFGVEAEAARLGVSRNHLWQVLVGRRQSKRLMALVQIKPMPMKPPMAQEDLKAKARVT